MKLLTSSLLAASLALGSQGTLAQDQSPAVVGELGEDQMRGVVLDVDVSENTVTVQPEETGSKVSVEGEGPVVLRVEEDTYVQDSVATTLLDRLNTVQAGDRVRVEFDLPQGSQAVRRIDTIDDAELTPAEERPELRDPSEQPTDRQ